MNADFSKKKKNILCDRMTKCVVIILIILAVVSLIGPIVSFGSETVYLIKTYSYTRVDKQFLKYENNIVYTTDGCEYEDRNNAFRKIILENENRDTIIVEQGSRVEVYTSDLTGEHFCVRINGKWLINDSSHPYYFDLYGGEKYGSYVDKDNESKNFLTFSALVVALFVFVATATTVFFTKNSKKRFLYVLLYVISILIGILKSFFVVSLVASVLYGMMAYYSTRRILIPNFIFASVHMVMSSIGIDSSIYNAFDFLVQGCSFVIFSYVGAVVVWIFQKMSDIDGNRFSKLFTPFNEFNPDEDDFWIKSCPAFIVLLIEVALLYGVSTQWGDYGGIVFIIPALIIIPPLYGLISYFCNSRIFFSHIIFAMVVFPAYAFSIEPGSRTSSADIINSSFHAVCFMVVYSLIPALLAYFIRIIRRKIIRSKK